MIEIVPNRELIHLYREWAKEDPVFYKAAEYLEFGQVRNSSINWNTKFKDRIRELRRNGKSWEWIFLRVKKDISMKTLKRQLKESNVAESTARNCYYSLK